MRRYGIMVILVLAAGLCILPTQAISEANDNKKSQDGKGQKGSPEKAYKSQGESKGIFLLQHLTYRPPLQGTSSRRIAGNTRGDTDESVILSVLVPDHAGLTTMTQPVLYWYLAGETSKEIEFTLNIEQEGRTVARKSINAGPGRGIKRLSLMDIGVALAPEKEYTWFISMAVDPAKPSKDIFSGGAIKLIKPSETLRKMLASAQKIEIPAIYAEEGVWYDALSAISDLIDEDVESSNLREQRAQLLDQVGLHQAAEFDREEAKETSLPRQ